MTIDLVMHVSRDERDRLNGTVRLARGMETHVFSGTLELMRALEELVPADGPTGDGQPRERASIVKARTDRERP